MGDISLRCLVNFEFVVNATYLKLGKNGDNYLLTPFFRSFTCIVLFRFKAIGLWHPQCFGDLPLNLALRGAQHDVWQESTPLMGWSPLRNVVSMIGRLPSSTRLCIRTSLESVLFEIILFCSSLCAPHWAVLVSSFLSVSKSRTSYIVGRLILKVAPNTHVVYRTLCLTVFLMQPD